MMWDSVAFSPARSKSAPAPLDVAKRSFRQAVCAPTPRDPRVGSGALMSLFHGRAFQVWSDGATADIHRPKSY